jgi:hypothetical protein
MKYSYAKIVIQYSRFGKTCGLMFSALTIQEDLTLCRLLDIYTGIVKCYPPCCNYIDRLLIKIQTLFPNYIKSTARIKTQDIITLTVNYFIDCTNQDGKDISSMIQVSFM